MTYFNTFLLLLVDILLNIEDNILTKICIYLKDTLYRSYGKIMEVRVGTSDGGCWKL